MHLSNLHQPPFNSTLFGVLRGVASYYALPYTDAFLYGASGHAFLMNIHKSICPSGPYCWNMEPLHPLLANLGLIMNDLGFYHAGSTPEERSAVETRLKTSLDLGRACSLLNMEHQLITGYDDTGFITAQPWPAMDFPPAHLTFDSWAEIAGDCHINFFVFTRYLQSAEVKAAAAGLRYGADLYQHPEHHSGGDYAVGAGAYHNWISAIVSGQEFNRHGNWWNAMVWSECRQFAAAFLDEVVAAYPGVQATAHALAADYRAISAALRQVGDKDSSDIGKVDLLQAAAATEQACTAQLADLAAQLER
ncbi:MAG: hypothetical protein ACYCZF_03820 [Anaerolineae bacterium]